MIPTLLRSFCPRAYEKNRASNADSVPCMSGTFAMEYFAQSRTNVHHVQEMAVLSKDCNVVVERSNHEE